MLLCKKRGIVDNRPNDYRRNESNRFRPGITKKKTERIGQATNAYFYFVRVTKNFQQNSSREILPNMLYSLDFNPFFLSFISFIAKYLYGNILNFKINMFRCQILSE